MHFGNSRRQFLRTAGSLVPGLGLGSAPARPNVLLAIADDWSWPFAAIAGDRTVQTPAFDRVAREGVLFRQAHTVAPTCTASRGSILTGQWFARLEQGGDLWSTLPAKFDVYPDLLEQAGYCVGFTGKGWGPGAIAPGGRSRNPAGPEFNQRTCKPPTRGIHAIDYTQNFADFLATRRAGQPFCFWYGGNEPHRPYEAGTGRSAGKRLADVRLPPGLPGLAGGARRPAGLRARNRLFRYAPGADAADARTGG